MPEIPQEAVQAAPAELIEAALREHMRLKITPTTIEHVQRGWPIWMSGGEAEAAARIAVDALAGAGLVVVSAEDLRTYLDRGKDLKAEVAAMNRLRATPDELNAAHDCDPPDEPAEDSPREWLCPACKAAWDRVEHSEDEGEIYETWFEKRDDSETGRG